MPKQTRSQLKKNFLSGKITEAEFQESLKEIMWYRGYYQKPGKNPKWSGPFRDTREEAEDDNAPYFNAGYQVGIYEEQS